MEAIEPTLLSARFPFLRYAVNNVLPHADRAGELGVSQNESMACFPTTRWVELNNSFEKFQTRKNPTSTRLLYILAEKNLPHLIKALPLSSSCLEMGGERYLCPLYAALAMGSHDAAKVLFGRLVETFHPTHEARQHLAELFSRPDPLPAFPRNFDFQKKGGLYKYILRNSEALSLVFLSAGLLDEETTQVNTVDIFLYAGLCKRELVMVEMLKSNTADDIISWKCHPLHLAAEHGLSELASNLLKVVNDVNAIDHEWRTPLLMAVQHGKEGVVKVLLDTGKADLNARDNEGDTPLLVAARHGKEGIVKILLDIGKADINACDKEGSTPLLVAARHGKEGLVRMMLDTGKADIDARDKRGRTALSHAAGFHCVGVARLLVETGLVGVDSRDNEGRSPLSYAASGAPDAGTENSETVIDLLLDSGKADIGSVDDGGQTPLLWAMRSAMPLFVKKKHMELLLNHGKEEAKRRDHKGRTCLSHAIIEEQFWAVDIILASGEADVDARDIQGRTPLSWLAEKLAGTDYYCFNVREEAARALIKGGANINAQDDLGRTPLSWAITVGKPYDGPSSRGDTSPTLRSVSLLLELGADPTIPDLGGRTPCDHVGGDREKEVRNALAPLVTGESFVC
ncbi:hypothetical protein PG985_010964 [Apiospora marii]|uniref:Ankyrin n=1 Tax=Apiospora marii TaxID=335849 RepID=A0ABR1SSB9_9PEZI